MALLYTINAASGEIQVTGDCPGAEVPLIAAPVWNSGGYATAEESGEIDGSSPWYFETHVRQQSVDVYIGLSSIDAVIDRAGSDEHFAPSDMLAGFECRAGAAQPFDRYASAEDSFPLFKFSDDTKFQIALSPNPDGTYWVSLHVETFSTGQFVEVFHKLYRPQPGDGAPGWSRLVIVAALFANGDEVMNSKFVNFGGIYPSFDTTPGSFGEETPLLTVTGSTTPSVSGTEESFAPDTITGRTIINSPAVDDGTTVLVDPPVVVIDDDGPAGIVLAISADLIEPCYNSYFSSPYGYNDLDGSLEAACVSIVGKTHIWSVYSIEIDGEGALSSDMGTLYMLGGDTLFQARTGMDFPEVGMIARGRDVSEEPSCYVDLTLGIGDGGVGTVGDPGDFTMYEPSCELVNFDPQYMPMDMVGQMALMTAESIGETTGFMGGGLGTGSINYSLYAGWMAPLTGYGIEESNGVDVDIGHGMETVIDEFLRPDTILFYGHQDGTLGIITDIQVQLELDSYGEVQLPTDGFDTEVRPQLEMDFRTAARIEPELGEFLEPDIQVGAYGVLVELEIGEFLETTFTAARDETASVDTDVQIHIESGPVAYTGAILDVDIGEFLEPTITGEHQVSGSIEIEIGHGMESDISVLAPDETASVIIEIGHGMEMPFTGVAIDIQANIELSTIERAEASAEIVYVMNVTNNAMSRYTNWPFIGVATVGGTQYAVATDAIYEVGAADTDAGTEIDCNVGLVRSRLGSRHMKRLHQMQVIGSVYSAGVRVRTLRDDDANGVRQRQAVEARSHGLVRTETHARRVNLRTKVKSMLWGFEIRGRYDLQSCHVVYEDLTKRY